MHQTKRISKYIIQRLSKNILLQLLLLFLVALKCGAAFPLVLKSCLYSTSLSLQAILNMALPWIVFSCIYNCMLEQKGKAIGFVLTLFLAVAISNACSASFGYLIGLWATKSQGHLFTVQQTLSLETLKPHAWVLNSFFTLDNRYPLTLGLLLGLWFAFFPKAEAEQAGSFMAKVTRLFLKKFFIPLLPLFTFGYMIKMQHDGILEQIANRYLPVFLLIFVAILIYSGLLLAIAAALKPRTWLRFNRHLLPATIMGFSSMSSLASMPLTLDATDKNTQGKHGHVKDMAQAIVPMTVNIHLVGNSIASMILIMVLLLTFEKPTLNVWGFTQFLLSFLQAKFAVAAIPAGGIVIILPILKSHLFFTTEMQALITSLYILLDPVITAGNILGNGAFALIVPKFFKPKHRPN